MSARALAIVATLLVAACDTYTPPPAPADPDPAPADPIEARLRVRARAEAPYMVRQGEAWRATLAAGERWSFTAVLPPGLCYKVLAQGADSLTELDLFLYEEDGVLAQQDATTGSGAILGTAQPLCPQEAQQIRVEARATEGTGTVVAQLYASP